MIRDWGKTQVVDMRRRFTGRPALISRSGTLRESFASHVEGSWAGGDLKALAYSTGTGSNTLTGKSYVSTQEGDNGAPTIIRAKRVAALTIPTSANIGADGLPKYKSAAALRGQGRTRRVNNIILVKEGSGWHMMWVLRREVSIPPRLRFMDSIRDRMPQRRAQIVRAVQAALKGA